MWTPNHELAQRIRNRNKQRAKTPTEKDISAKKKLHSQEALTHHIQAQQKFKDPETTQTSLFQE